MAIPGKVAVIFKAEGFSLLPMRAIRNMARVAKAREIAWPTPCWQMCRAKLFAAIRPMMYVV